MNSLVTMPRKMFESLADLHRGWCNYCKGKTEYCGVGFICTLRECEKSIGQQPEPNPHSVSSGFKATVKDLRALSHCLAGSDDRELLQHAADLIEVLGKSHPSAKPEKP